MWVVVPGSGGVVLCIVALGVGGAHVENEVLVELLGGRV